MENRNSWLKELSRNEKMWAIELNAVPSMIKLQYTRLKNLAEEGQVYGVMLQIKDVYETLCKIPNIMALIVIESNKTYKDDPIYAEIVSSYLSSPMSMGDWDSLGKLIIKADMQFHLPTCLIEILKRTKKLYAKEITPDVPNVVNWRNDSIGHGALKFEDDVSYQEEIKSLLLMLKEYFDGRSRYSVRSLYDTVYFEIGGVKLICDQLMLPQDGNALKLFVASTAYEVKNFIDIRNLKYYLFDSFYRKKNNLVKYYYYIDGKKEMLKSNYFSDLYEKYVERPNKDFLIQSEVISREDDMILEYLNEPTDYIKPVNLLEALVEKMDEIGHGIISLFMERGTGKTAFSNQMNGLYQKRALVEDCLSRCYHIQNAAIRGSGDFISSVNFCFQHSSNPLQDIRSGAGEMACLTKDTQKPAEDMAAFLNYYHRCYQKTYTIFILDGIDEVTEQTSRIMDYLPPSYLLDQGVFILLLSRLKEEKTVHGTSRRYIERAENLSVAKICLKRTDDENVRILKQYIEKQVQEGRLPCCIDQDELIKRADYRFLFLKACISVKPEIVLNNHNEYSFIASYMNYVLSFYGPKQKRMLEEIAVTIALFPSFSISNYQLYLNCEITYNFVGFLNDLLPVMTVLHIDGEDIYNFADAAYMEFVLHEYSDVAGEVVDSFYKSMETKLNTYFVQGSYSIRSDSRDSESEDEINHAIAFYAEGIIGIWNRAGNNEDIRNKFFSCILGAVLCGNLISDPWAQTGYGLYIKEEIRKSIYSAILYCIKNNGDAAARTWCNKICQEFRVPYMMEKYRDLRDLSSLLYDADNNCPVLNYIVNNDTVIKVEDCFWFIVDLSFSFLNEETKASVLDMIRRRKDLQEAIIEYIKSRVVYDGISTDDLQELIIHEREWIEKLTEIELPPKQEEIILNLQLGMNLLLYLDDCAKDCLGKIKAKGYVVDKKMLPFISNDVIKRLTNGTLRKLQWNNVITEAIHSLLDFSAPWNCSDDKDETFCDIIISSSQEKKKTMKISNDQQEFFSAIYERMCFERDYGNLSSFIESGHWLGLCILDVLKTNFGYEHKYFQSLKAWICIIRKARKEDGRNAIQLLSKMMIEGTIWLKSNSRDDEAIALLEDYIYNIDTQAFLTSSEFRTTTTSELFINKPLVYCTQNAVYLLNEYLLHNLYDKFEKLMGQIEKNVPRIDKYLIPSLSYRELAFLEIEKYKFMRYRKTIDYFNSIDIFDTETESFDEYITNMVQKHQAFIENILQSISKYSDFGIILYHVDLMMEYVWQMQDWDEGIMICDRLLSILGSRDCYEDPVVKESLDKSIHAIILYHSFFNYMNGDGYTEPDGSGWGSRSSRYSMPWRAPLWNALYHFNPEAELYSNRVNYLPDNRVTLKSYL